jgi:nitrite reductase (NO-forming)
MMKVEGAEDKIIYSGKVADNVYLPEGSGIQHVNEKEEVMTAKTVEDRIKMGKVFFTQNCAACHQPDGKGIPGAFPPLAGSDFLNKDVKRAMGIVKNGLTGEITVNGEKFNGVMPALGVSDEDAANVLTYVYSAWGNSKKVVNPKDFSGLKTGK